MNHPNVLYSEDWHTNVATGYYVSIPPNSYDLDNKTLDILYQAKGAEVAEADWTPTTPTALTVTGIEPVDNEPEIHQAISDQIIADAAP